jgi:SAM-dependent methyltransferase
VVALVKKGLETEMRMNKLPELFDQVSRQRHQERARAANSDAWFVQDYACDSVHERLTEVNRTFTKVAIVGWRGDEWAKSLGFPDAELVAEADILSFADVGQYDLIIHAFSLHWSNDPVGQLVQIRRALRKDGLMMMVFLGGETLIELRQSLAHGETLIEGGISPRVSPMIELRDAGGLLQRAGFGLPVADKETLNVEYRTPLKLMQDVRMMGESNALISRRKSFMKRATFNAAQEQYHSVFRTDDQGIHATFDLVFLTGWSPDESQQKPLQPGSAKHRLADALGVPELDPNKP